MKRVISFALVAAVALAGGTAYAGGSPTNGGCGKDLEKNTGKITAAVIKQVAKVYADYQKLLDKEPVPSQASLEKLAAKTQKGYDKTWGSTGKSAVDKGIAALTGLVGKGKCNDATLAANGHIPPSVASNFWANLLVTKAVQDGINAANQREAGALAANNILGQVEATGTAAILCPGCAQAFTGFCKVVPSNWGGDMTPTPTGSVSELYGSLNFYVGGPLGAIGLADQVNTNVLCASDWLGDDILGVSSAGIGQFVPIGIGAVGAAACVRPIQTTGWINCNTDATHPAVDFDICQNHNLAEGGDCSAGASFCLADQPQDTNDDGVVDYTASGPCYTVNTSNPVAGDAFINSATQITTCTSGPGPDGLACSGDESGCTYNSPGFTWTTTGSGNLTILNTNIPAVSPVSDGSTATAAFGPGTPYSFTAVPAAGAPAITADICTAMFANANGTLAVIGGVNEFELDYDLRGGFTSINGLFDVDSVNVLKVISE